MELNEPIRKQEGKYDLRILKKKKEKKQPRKKSVYRHSDTK